MCYIRNTSLNDYPQHKEQTCVTRWTNNASRDTDQFRVLNAAAVSTRRVFQFDHESNRLYLSAVNRCKFTNVHVETKGPFPRWPNRFSSSRSTDRRLNELCRIEEWQVCMRERARTDDHAKQLALARSFPRGGCWKRLNYPFREYRACHSLTATTILFNRNVFVSCDVCDRFVQSDLSSIRSPNVFPIFFFRPVPRFHHSPL